MPEHSDPFADLPEQEADPVEWDPYQRRFVPQPERASARPPAAPSPPSPSPSPPSPPTAASPEGRDPRRFFVGASAVGHAPPPRDGIDAPASPPPAAPPPTAPPGIPGAPVSGPDPVPSPQPAPSTKPGRRRWWQRKRNWILLICVVLPFLLIAGGLIYADIRFRQIHRVPVGSLLDSGGSGTNILIVGSDSRANEDASASSTGGDVGNATDVAGQRSDTIMILHMGSDGAKMLSIPRDLIVKTADTGQQTRINASYNTDLGGGPARLLKTVQQNFGIPINRYMEVDFVTFAGLVDAVGGVNIDFPYPAFDTQSGLDVKQSGSVKLNGQQALAYVRSRHYTEIKEDGKPHEDPTADLGRIGRQQDFMRAVMYKVASTQNPISLMKASGKISNGLRIDDKLGLFDALRLVWSMRGLHPIPTKLPVAVNRDGATLHLQQPDADKVLADFK
jgi:LCP family protein required for cell wall assembly